MVIGYAEKYARGRLLPIMFLDNRPNAAHFRHASLGYPVEGEGLIRPRDRKAVRVAYRIDLARESTDGNPILRRTFARE